MNDSYLYRGISEQMYLECHGLLIPKQHEAFEYVFKADGTIEADGSAVASVSCINAVLRHQLKQEGFPTSGISTTPIYERAVFYATHGNKYVSGYIFVINRTILTEHGVSEFIVSRIIPNPSIPEDHEVILVAKDHGMLPDKIVTDIISINPNDTP
jgi:hypothetical protein